MAGVPLKPSSPGSTARDGDRMVAETVTRGDTLAMPEIGVEIPIDDLYRGVEPDEAAGSGDDGSR